jgi:hypothetical protein
MMVGIKSIRTLSAAYLHALDSHGSRCGLT